MMIRPQTTLTLALASDRRRAAFTLLEVLVVMAILVIIAGAGAFGAFKALDMARMNEAKLKMEKIANAVQIYNTQYGMFPQSAMELVSTSPDGSAPVLVGGQAAVTDPWGAPFSFEVLTDETGSTRVLVTCSGKNPPFTWPER